jgi:sortase A
MAIRRSLSFALILTGAILCGLAGFHYLRGFDAQRQARFTFEKTRNPRSAAPALLAIPAARGFARASYPQGQPIAWLLIPSAQIDAIVFAGSTSDILEKGPGHVQGTELPGGHSGSNNCVITAHRDSHFRNLGRVRKGELIELTTPQGLESYKVVSREVVDAGAVGVLAPTATSRLTLITCYPFSFIGHAPKRLVVIAEREPSSP